MDNDKPGEDVRLGVFELLVELGRGVEVMRGKSEIMCPEADGGSLDAFRCCCDPEPCGAMLSDRGRC